MKRTVILPYLFAHAAVFAAGLGVHAQATTVTYETIAITGDAAPGAGAGVVFDRVYFPVINNAGQVAFQGLLSGAGVTETNNTGAWFGDNGTVSLLAREGDAVPEVGPDVVMDTIGRLRISDSGQVAMVITFNGPGLSSTNNLSVWSQDQNGVLGMVAREEEMAPSTVPGDVFRSISPFITFSDSGQVAFGSSLEGPIVDGAQDSGIWAEDSGQLSMVVRRGDAAPGTSSGTVFYAMWSPVINESGEIAFVGFLSGDDIDETNDIGVWAESGQTLNLIARAGSSAPGAGPGAVFLDDFRPPVINDAGQVAFLGGYDAPSGRRAAIWSQGSGTLDVVAVERGLAPGIETSSATFRELGEPTINGAGDVAFIGRIGSSSGVTAQNNTGIWSQRDGELLLVVREGDTPPGAEMGVEFDDFGTGVTVATKPVMNNSGQIAFYAEVRGPDIDSFNRRGVYATNPSGQLVLVARQGDIFDVNDDPLLEDLRTIQNVDVVFSTGQEGSSGGEDGRRSGFNDAGQLVFSLNFTDGTYGIFIASIADILTGDITGDGFVGVSDLDILLANWGDVVGSGTGAVSSGDLSGDGVVGQADLDILLGAWGDGSLPDINIPEPSSFAILSLGGFILLRRRRSEK